MAENNQQEQTPSQQAGQDAKKVASKAKETASKVKDTAKKAKEAVKKAKKTTDKTKKGKSLINGIKAVGKLIANAIKLLFSFIKWLISVLGPWGFLILIVVIVIAIVICVVAAVFVQTTSGGYNSSTQTMTSYFGIAGDSFYGARAFYYDNEESSEKLSQSYIDFTAEILNKVNNYGITIEPEDSSVMTSTIIQRTTISYANKLTSTSYSELNSITSQIDHFGFKETAELNERTIVLDSIANSIREYYTVKDSSTNTILDPGTNADITAAKKALNEAYDAHFGYMNKVCSKILIKDYLLNSDDEHLTLDKRQYISLVYMPKKDITINNLVLIYKVDGEHKVNAKLIHQKGTDQEVIVENEIDSSWYDGTAKQFQSNILPIELNEFTAIGETTNTFKDSVSIFELIKSGTYSVLFNELEDSQFNESNIQYSIKNSDYLMLDFNADLSFNFIDMYAKYE